MNESLPAEAQKLVCLSHKVAERIECLRKAGTTGCLLAGKAELLISRLKSGETWQAYRKIALRTQHGENRIRKCVKYDLGWGFRLITLLRNNRLHICYLGPHDECDRWLADNSRIKEIDLGRSTVFQVVSQKMRENASGFEKPYEEFDDLDIRLKELPDKTLRRIFCGLVAARKKITQFKYNELQRNGG